MRFCGKRSRFSTDTAPHQAYLHPGRDDEGRTTIRFGDGISGARLPTSQNNVRAEYRKGIGLGGLAQTGPVEPPDESTTRIKGVPESGGCAGSRGSGVEGRHAYERTAYGAHARSRGVVAGLRISRRTFSGVAKAQAVWVWDGRKRSIFLTVAGPAGGNC